MDFRMPGRLLGNLLLTSALLALCGVAAGQSNNKKQQPAPAQHNAPAPAQHSAPAAQQRPANNNQSRPMPNGAGRGPNNMNAGNRNGTNNANNGGMNRGGMNNPRGTNNAGGMGTNRAGTNGNLRGGGSTGTKAGGTMGTKAGGANATRGNTTATGRRVTPTTTREIKTRSGVSAQATYKGGKVRSIQAGNMKIQHSTAGQRRIETTHNGRTVVTEGKRGGYMQRAYLNRNGRTYVQRTYVAGGRTYVYAYHSYYYGGVAYYGYAPAYYYQPVYYGWAYNPWPAPVYYNWGYYNAPWYGYYGYYYAPYPAYPTASLWLTDYLVAENLRLAYEASLGANTTPKGFERLDALNASLWPGDSLIAGNLLAAPSFFLEAAKETGGGQQAQLTPEVKQALADEIKQQIADDKAAAEGTKQASNDETPAALDPKHKIFVVASSLDTSTDDGDDCTLSQGDIIERASDTADADNNVETVVKSAQKNDCKVGSQVTIAATDLQEMHNHFRETLDAGMKSLADKSGKDGLPAAPDTHTKAGEVPPPAPDSNATSEMQQQQKDADQLEADVPKQDDSAAQ